MLLFSDESGFCLHPKLGRVWAKKGTQPFVVTKSQHHKRLNVFGWVDPLGGRHGIVKQDRGNTDGFLGMLTAILCRYKKVGLLPIEWVLFKSYNVGNMHVRTLRRRYS
jgi:hypothetical protein